MILFIRKYKLWLCLFWVLTQPLYGQDCKKILLDYIEELSGHKQPDKNKAYFMHFTVKTLCWDNYRDKVPDINAKLFLTNSSSFYETSLVSILSDSKDFFIINHPQKSIVWNKPKSIEERRKSSEKSYLKNQRELVINSLLLSCVDSVMNNSRLKIISLQILPKYQITYKIMKVIYNYNMDKKLLEKAIIFYSRDSKLRTQTIDYKIIDFDSKQNKSQTCFALVFEKSGKLKSHYKTYSLIDKRN